MDFEDIFDNLDSELGNFKIRLSKNVYGADNIEILSTFLDDFSDLCKVKKFDVELSEVEQLTSYTTLLQNTKSESQEYVSDSIRRFYIPLKILFSRDKVHFLRKNFFRLFLRVV